MAEIVKRYFLQPLIPRILIGWIGKELIWRSQGMLHSIISGHLAKMQYIGSIRVVLIAWDPNSSKLSMFHVHRDSYTGVSNNT